MGEDWFYLDVRIKHGRSAADYTLHRRIVENSFKLETSSPRRWFFTRLPQ